MTYYNNTFRGHWLTGAALVEAFSPEEAARLLNVELSKQSLEPVEAISMKAWTGFPGDVQILNNGDY